MHLQFSRWGTTFCFRVFHRIFAAWGRSRGTSSLKIWSGGIVPEILSSCKILSTRLLALGLQCWKMCFLPLQQDFYSKSGHAFPPPRIPVRSTHASQDYYFTDCDRMVYKSGRIFFLFVTNHTFHRRTHRKNAFSCHAMQRGLETESE